MTGFSSRPHRCLDSPLKIGTRTTRCSESKWNKSNAMRMRMTLRALNRKLWPRACQSAESFLLATRPLSCCRTRSRRREGEGKEKKSKRRSTFLPLLSFSHFSSSEWVSADSLRPKPKGPGNITQQSVQVYSFSPNLEADTG